MRFGLVSCCQAGSHFQHPCFSSIIHFYYLSVEKFVPGGWQFAIGPQGLSLQRSVKWHQRRYQFAPVIEQLALTVVLIGTLGHPLLLQPAGQAG